jgi:mono/diheme cytochrome c family protein
VTSHSLRIVQRLAVAILLMIPFVLAAACGGGAPKASPEQIAAGEKVFMTTCATCHGKDAHGLPKLGKDLHSNQFIHEKTDQELIDYVKVGRLATDPLNTTGVAMPPKGGNPALSETDIANVVAYLRTLD